MARPTGTVTFLFTDIAGSSRLWEDHGPRMRDALSRHDEILRGAITDHDGYVFATGGDSFAAAFSAPLQAVQAAVAAQHLLAIEDWHLSTPLRIRMALHTGVAEERDGDYFGPPLNRCARLLSAAHGGQILATRATADLVGDAVPAGVALRDLGEHRLRDLARPERVFVLEHPDEPPDLPPLRTLGLAPHNLPIQLTSFVGRDQELAEAHKLLAGSRLLTLTGVGGSGKTRLALQLAAGAIADYPDGAWMVELAPVADPGLVPNAVAGVLDVRAQGDRAMTDCLAAHLRAKRLLLMLDNCEHVTGAAADLAVGLLRHCPDLRILATSREMLGVPGEVAYLVRSMSVPDPDEGDAAFLRRLDSVRLFEERAAAVRPDFRVTPANAGAVATLCRRLDGLPLAVELAAARVRMLTPAQIAARLDDRFRLLTGGSRTVLPRQQTLEAAVDWSYELLEKPERLLFDRLSVFAGGFSLEDAEQVCSGDDLDVIDVLDLVSHLCDKSLVVVDTDGSGGARYRMLETLRQYAEKKLAASGTADAVRNKHAAHFAGVAAGIDLQGPDQEGGLAKMAVDHDNIRAALRWCLESGETELGLGLAFHTWYFWHIRGFWREGLDWLDRLLAAERAVSPALRSRALHAAGTIASTLSDLDGATARLEEAVRISRDLGEADRVAAALNNLAGIHESRGGYEKARDLYEEALALVAVDDRNREVMLQNLGWTSATLGDLPAAEDSFREALRLAQERDLPVQVAGAKFGLSAVAGLRGDLDDAVRLTEEGIAVVRRIDAKPFLANGLIALAGAHLRRDDLASARAALVEAHPLVREIDSISHIAWWVRNAAFVHARAGRPEQASRLLGADEALRGETVMAPWDRPPLQSCKDSIRDALGEETALRAFEGGRGLTRFEALDLGILDLGDAAGSPEGA